MITPKQFAVEDFIPQDETRVLSSLKAEALVGSALIDNLILLRFCEDDDIKRVLRDKYRMVFAHPKVDPTPDKYREIADKHKILIEEGRTIIVYIPLGQEVDDALLQVDIPSHEIGVRFIADYNYRILKTGADPNVLSLKVANFRPLLVFKRLIMDCLTAAGTDLHLESVHIDKKPAHRVRYRVKREMVESQFGIDYEMMEQVVLNVVNKLSPHSVMDVDAVSGITTDIRDLFGDGSVDVRLSGMRNSAGFSIDFAIQSTNTTTKKVNELGFPEKDVELIRQIAKRRTGLTLVTGEMRSGKNTTIFAMLNEIVNDPIRIVEYSNPIENHMPFSQVNYKGDPELLARYMKMAKKQDIDIAVLNEIPNAEVAFAVRDLVNSAIGVITTTHVNRIWHLPNKLHEFFGDDYKTIVSQLNAVLNHKMFRRWSAPNMQKRMLVKEQGDFEMFCYAAGVRQYFVPEDSTRVKYELQPLTEILVITDAMKTSMLNFDEIWRAEQMLQLQIQQQHATLENKCAEYVNAGYMSLEEMRRLY